MIDVYLDTSAAMKLITDEVGSAAMQKLIWDEDRRLIASWLLHTELHCAVVRRQEIGRALVDAVLGMTRLAEVHRDDLVAAAGLEGLRTNDAIHLVTAIRLGAQEILTYNSELAAAAARVGIRAVAPGIEATYTTGTSI